MLPLATSSGRATKRSSRVLFCLLSLLALGSCATSSGVPATAIAEPAIVAAYIPLRRAVHLGLDDAEGAAVVVAPGIAATNAHNANLLDSKLVIGTPKDYDLLFFRTDRKSVPPVGEPKPGESVAAYGEGENAQLRLAHGVVRAITNCQGCGAPAYFTFEGDAGPGFSGGPVIDAADGTLLGIVFGYRDAGKTRTIYAYTMSRVAAELSRLEGRPDAD